MITPRATRLIRAAGAQVFRQAAVALACDGTPLDARDRLVVVPTHAAAAHLLRGIEDARSGSAAHLLPDFITPAEIAFRFAERLSPDRPILTPAEREVLLVVACRTVRAGGIEPPFQVRPALVAEILAWYDELRRHQHDVASFERLALAALEPGAVEDRGAERLVRQTRFLVAAFREFERAVADAGSDEHTLRRAVMETPAERPIRHVVLAVTDRSVDAHGLAPADWDLLARVPGLERLDVLVTDGRLAGALHERLHRLLPGIEEVRFEAHGHEVQRPVLHAPSAESAMYVVRDREEEVAAFARQVKQLIRAGEASALDRVAFVVNQPLPYVYVAPAILRSGGVPCRVSESSPLAAEPYAAALDLVLSCVETGFGRAAVHALLGSPHFRFTAPDGGPVHPRALERATEMLPAPGASGDGALERLPVFVSDHNGDDPTQADASATAEARAAADVLRRMIGDLRSLVSPAPAAVHLGKLFRFITAFEVVPADSDPWHDRHQRARGAVLGTVAALRDAYERFDSTPVPFDEVAALIRRWIDGQTFAPPGDDSGVHVVDAATAPFGGFEHVHLAGLVDGEWPQRRRRSIFYSAGVLRDLGWPADGLRIEGARAAFADLLTLPSRSVAASTFLLEDDALVTPSPFVEEIDRIGLERMERSIPSMRIFEDEALALEAVPYAPPDEPARTWTSFRLQSLEANRSRDAAAVTRNGRAYSLSALERYQNCPFQFFAANVLRLPEPAEDRESLSARERGRFVHEVLQRFFEAWDRQWPGTPIEVGRLDEARALCMEVAEPLLARLGDADAALEGVRLFGSAISVGVVDIALAVEVAREGDIEERWLEHRFEGAFTLGSERRVTLKGVVDRVDLLRGRRLRVVDYKTGQAPDPRRALQAVVYAVCLQEALTKRDRAPWEIAEAAYVSFAGRRALVPVVQGGDPTAGDVLEAARARVFAVLDGIARGDFPPRPHDPLLCRSCAYPSVCRKEYVDE